MRQYFVKFILRNIIPNTHAGYAKNHSVSQCKCLKVLKNFILINYLMFSEQLNLILTTRLVPTVAHVELFEVCL